jgi:1-deoxy-D-xylulose-5-phosphate reductoisomerase
VFKRQLCILGSTGSIGRSTLDVVRLHPEKFNVSCLVASKNIDVIFEQCVEFSPHTVVLVSKNHAKQLSDKLKSVNLDNIEVLSGEPAIIEVAQCQKSDTVMAAIVGASGLLPTLAAVNAGKRVLLANKEALVTSGAIFMEAVKASGAELLPIDSEHNAIFQCLPAHQQQNLAQCQPTNHGISKILLTGSGGPFRTRAIETFDTVLPEEACNHPNWVMGQKNFC